MSQSPAEVSEFDFESDYADAARQLNKLVRAGRSYSGHERNCCYLNTGTGQFANASMVSGFDFSEDGRAVALCDWDSDGDQDFWVSNRTAPQLRFMQNQLPNQKGKSNFVSFQLVGTESNRSAIGASVRLVLDAGETLKKTVRAGEGFLASSSKRLHFGLGKSTKIAEVHVRWPSGQEESLGPLTSINGFFEVTEGDGKLKALTRQHHKLTPTPTKIPAQLTATHNWLNEPLPCPPLPYKNLDGQLNDASVATGTPTVVNLWATWCQPCIEELSSWSVSHEDFQKRDIQLLALCTDAIDGNNHSVRDVLGRLNFRGDWGDATPALVDTLQHLQNTVYDHHRPLPVPTTLLLDGTGNVRGFYKGPVSVERLCDDVDQLASSEERLPFAGTWLAPQATHNVNLLAEELFRDGYKVEATAFVERLQSERFLAGKVKARLFLAQQLSTEEKVESLRQLFAVLKSDPNNASAHEQLGLLMARANRPKEAIKHFELAVSNSRQPSARTLFNYAKSLRETNSMDAAIVNFGRAIKIDNTFAPAFEQRGLIRASIGDFPNAAIDFARASELKPKIVRHRVNAAMALGRLRRFEDAWNHLAPVLADSTSPKRATMLGAQLLNELNRHEEAVELLERYLARNSSTEDVRTQLEELRKQ